MLPLIIVKLQAENDRLSSFWTLWHLCTKRESSSDSADDDDDDDDGGGGDSRSAFSSSIRRTPNWNNFLKKMDQPRPLFLFIFVSLTCLNLDSNWDWKKRTLFAWDLKRGSRMEGTDESTELRQPLKIETT